MRDKRDAVNQCRGGNPSIGRLDWTPIAARAVECLSPSKTRHSIKRRDYELFEKLCHFTLPGSPPVSLERPAVTFGKCHKRNDRELTVQMRKVQITSRVFLEDKRQYVGVHDDARYQDTSPSPSGVSSSRHFLTVVMNSSMLSSSGQNLPRRRAFSKSNGPTP